MRIASISLLLLLSVLISCKEEDVVDDWHSSQKYIYTIPELTDWIGVDQYTCNDPLACEGMFVNITGYINIDDISPENQILPLYYEEITNLSKAFDQKVVEVEVNEKYSLNIYNKIDEIYQEMPNTSWQKVNIKAQIYGWDTAKDDLCEKCFGLIGYSLDKEQ